MNVLILSLWFFWCVLHSLLITRSVEAHIRKWRPALIVWYRFFYNVFSLLSFVTLVILTHQIQQESIFQWQGGWMGVRFLLLGIALLLFVTGAKKYDMDSFLGIRQIQKGKELHLISEGEEISTRGILGVIRHPWYSGTILFLWSFRGAYSGLEVGISLILSIYVLVGAWLEEKKIIARHGKVYTDYRQQVSMFLPWKWIWQKILSSGSEK